MGCVVSDALEHSLDVCMTEWERGRERDEFVRAALLYQPSSSALSSRFTRSRQADNDDTVEVPRDTEVSTHTHSHLCAYTHTHTHSLTHSHTHTLTHTHPHEHTNTPTALTHSARGGHI